MKKMLSLTIMLLGLATAGAHAQTQGIDHSAHHPPAAPAPAGQAADFVDGEVRRVDRDAKKLTLRHGPIPNLDMPEMTMVFQVPDDAMLEGLKTGDKVRFKADRVGGQFTVVAVQPAQ